MAVAITQPDIVTEIVACLTTEPLVPEMEKEYVPVPADRETVSVSVDVALPPADGVMGFPENEAEMPPGMLLVARLTGSLKTPVDCTVTVAVPDDA